MLLAALDVCMAGGGVLAVRVPSMGDGMCCEQNTMAEEGGR